MKLKLFVISPALRTVNKGNVLGLILSTHTLKCSEYYLIGELYQRIAVKKSCTVSSLWFNVSFLTDLITLALERKFCLQ